MWIVLPARRSCVGVAILVLLHATPGAAALAVENQSGAVSGSAIETSNSDDTGFPIDVGLDPAPDGEDVRDTAAHRGPTDEPLALWEQLSSLTPSERANAAIELELRNDAEVSDRDAARTTASLWHHGQYEAAIAHLQELEQDGHSLVGLVISWKVPRTLPGKRLLDGRIGGTRDEAQALSIDFDAQNGNLFVAIRWGSTTGTSAWTMNMSDDGGVTWSESDVFSSAAGIIDVDCVVVDDYVYVAYVAGNALDEARIRRCLVSTGLIDVGYGYQKVFDAGTNAVEEVALAANADDTDNRIYYVIIQDNNVLRFAYDVASDGTTFVENSPATSNPQFGLDATYDNHRSGSNCSEYLYVSYSGADGDIHVLGRSESSWTDWTVEAGTGIHRTTAISAYEDTIICAFEYPYTNGTGIRYQISYDCGDSWSPGSLAVPDGSTIFSYYEPDVDVRNGHGTAIIYQAEAGEFDPMLYRTRDGFAPGPWTDPAPFSDYDVYTGSDTAIGYLPPVAGETFSHGALFLSLDPDFRTPYFDRPRAAGPLGGDATPPTVNIDAPDAIDCACDSVDITGSVGDPEGTYVGDRLEVRRRGTSYWIEVASAFGPRSGTLYTWNTTGLPEDYYDVRIVAQNECGLENSDTTFVYLPTGFDTVELTQPTNGLIYGGTICINGTAFTEACFTQYTVCYRPKSAGTWTPVDPSNPVYTSPVIDGSLAIWDPVTLGLADGDYDLRLLAEDECGNTAGATITITLDNEPPTAELTVPGNCAAFLSATSIDIYGEVYDENVDEWTLAVTGGPYGDWHTIAGPFSSNLVGLLATWDTTGLPACAYSVRLQASDLSTLNCGPNTHVTSAFNTHETVSYATLKVGGIPSPAEIGDVVWKDYNGDGVRDVGEPGIPNVTLDLIDPSGPTVVDTQTTDSGGFYLFYDLPAGAFEVNVTDTHAVLTGFTLTGGTNPHAVYLGVGEAYDGANFGYHEPALPLYVDLQPDATAQGVLPVQFLASLSGEDPPVTFEWEILTTSEVFSTQDNPFVFDHILDASNGNLEFAVSVWDNVEGPVTDVSWILIAVDPIFYDLNGDGCNTVDDWQALYESWRLAANDPSGDGFVDVRDFLYLNISGDCEPSKRR